MRIRTVKPEFWQSEDLSQVSDKAKLLAIGLLNMADDEGYLKAHPAIIKSQLFPFNTGSLNIQGILTELSNVRYIDVLTGDDGKQYVHIVNFLKHQKVNRPSPSKIKDSVTFTDNSVSGQGGVIIGKEQGTGKGKEQGKEEELPKGNLCPHTDIVNLYHECLPELSKIKVWTDKRKGYLRTAWNGDPKRQTLDYWKGFFNYVKQSDFLMGRANDFKADLEWIVKPANFIKIIEGKYENQQ